MLYAKTFRNHLKQGGVVEDWLHGEPGRCSNGGRYYDRYQIRGGVLMVRSSYEDAEWQEAGMSVKEFARWAHTVSDERPYFTDGRRFEFV